MSFYTSLTGLNAATTELAVTSNNIANSATAGFKRSTASFGDIFATSPHQRAAAVVGCLLYTSPSPRDKRQSRMPSSA